MAAGPDMAEGQTTDALQRELAAARAERDEAQAREAALAEVLRAINASRGELKPVFDLITERAMTMCDADGADLLAIKDGFATALALRNPTPMQVEFWNKPFDLRQGALELVHAPRTLHIVDLVDSPVYKARHPLPVMAVEGGGIHTLVHVPLVGEHGLIGQFALFRRTVRPFTARQIALVEAFAAQAALALENARLVSEQREALERQTATAEVLEVINASPGDLVPVFDTMLQKAMRLCEAAFGVFGRFDGTLFEVVTHNGVPPALIEAVAQIQSPPPNSGLGRLAAGEAVVQLADLANTDIYRSGFVGATALVDIAGARTAIFVALRKDDILLGAIVMYRREIRAFTDKQIGLLQNFAAQAVIAMENARLLTEQREALEQQTASAEILRVISQSPTDVQPVLDAVAASAQRLCGGRNATIALRDGNEVVRVAGAPSSSAIGVRDPLDHSTFTGRAIAGRRTAHAADVLALDPTQYGRSVELARQFGYRALMAAPMMSENEAIGCILVDRAEPGAFTPRQIALLETFAAQAVIAVENVRLFTELRESLEQQTATGEVLRVIAQSPTDVQPVLEVVVKAAQHLCGAGDVVISLRDGDELTTAAHDGPFERPPPRRSLDRDSAQGRAMIDRTTIHLPDTQQLDPAKWSTAIALSRRHGIRAILAAPMLREGAAIGTIMLRKFEAGPFSPRQIALLETFTAQAVIAIENVRLFTEQRELLEQQTATAEILRVISQSPTDIAPVMTAVARSAVRFCGAEDGHVFLRDGDEMISSAHEGPLSAHPPGHRDALDAGNTARAHTIVEARITHLADTLAPQAEAAYRSIRANSIQHGFRAQLNAPMLREGQAIGCICLRRRDPGAFSSRQIALLETFAAQAVIAIENVRLFTELNDSLEQQTATAEILDVISRSPTDVTPVLDVVVKAARRFCGAEDAVVGLRDGDELTIVAHEGPIPTPGARRTLDRSSTQGRAILDGGTVHLPDLRQLDPAEWGKAMEFSRQLDVQASLAAPLMREGTAIGSIMLRRREAGAFSPRQIELLETFAAQAVIAIENVRLFTELRRRTDDLSEALEYQTATSEVLEAIGRSTSDIQPVLDTMLKAALRLCRTESGGVAVQQGDAFRYVATLGWPPAMDSAIRARRIVPTRGMIGDRTLLERKVVEIRDVETDPDFPLPEVARGWHTSLGVPLMREGEPIGVITLTRRKVEPFTERQIALVKTFADQAVIAMENARLMGELTRREEELRVTFDHMGDGVVMFDAGLQLASWNRNFQELLDIPDSFVAGRPNLEDYVRLLVGRGEVGQGDAAHEIARYSERANQPWSTERERPDGRVLEVRNNPVPGGGAVLIYSDITVRKKAEGEIRAARDAAEAALERQTATADILKVIASSPTDVQPVLEAVVKAAVRFCGATDAVIHLREGREAVSVAHEGPLGATLGRRAPLDGGTGFSAAILERRTIHFPDVATLDPVKYAGTHLRATEFAFRALISAPLLREGTAVGTISLRRIEPGAFTPQQIELLETFAAQAVIAIENVRLFTELRDSLERLKAAQANLVQSEKMASLGQLTAGIAHEIKNPLNFVNNFAILSVELLDELKEVAGPALATLDGEKRAEFDETMALLTSNLGKIAEHGKRADGIVRSMLSHSRGSSGDWQASDINALVEETLNLAYHGARAQDNEFNVTLERDLEKTGKPIEVVPQDLTRVFLNLFGNGFYAANKRRLADKAAGFRPTLKVSTRDLGEAVEVRVRDNGTGIAPEARDKLFEPFFTTKPTGEGTGLGLSISYDIVTQQHGGTIEVESEVGRFTEFTVRLPRSRRIPRTERA